MNSWLGDFGSEGSNAASSASSLKAQLPPLLNQIGIYSLGIIQNVLLIIFFFCLVIYMLISPRPLLEMYLAAFGGEKKEDATKAFSLASRMTIGWMWSNIVAGALRATIVWFFLYFMGIPGVWVWAGVDFLCRIDS